MLPHHIPQIKPHVNVGGISQDEESSTSMDRIDRIMEESGMPFPSCSSCISMLFLFHQGSEEPHTQPPLEAPAGHAVRGYNDHRLIRGFNIDGQDRQDNGGIRHAFPILFILYIHVVSLPSGALKSRTHLSASGGVRGYMRKKTLDHRQWTVDGRQWTVDGRQ